MGNETHTVKKYGIAALMNHEQRTPEQQAMASEQCSNEQPPVEEIPGTNGTKPTIVHKDGNNGMKIDEIVASFSDIRKEKSKENYSLDMKTYLTRILRNCMNNVCKDCIVSIRKSMFLIVDDECHRRRYYNLVLCINRSTHQVKYQPIISPIICRLSFVSILGDKEKMIPIFGLKHYLKNRIRVRYWFDTNAKSNNCQKHSSVILNSSIHTTCRKSERLGNNQSEEHNAEQTSLEQLFEQPPEPQPSGQPINEQPEQDLFKVEETPTDSANLNPYIGSYYGTKQGKAMDNLMLEMDGELVKPNEAMVILSGLKETSLRGPVMNCDSENNEVYMAPGRLGLRIFLALLNGQPYGLEGELTTREYAACMEMARRHANKRPCDVDSPPKPKPASCTKKYSPNSKKKTIENPPRFPSPPEPQPLPTKYGDVLAKKGADQVKLVYVKRLFETDTKAHQDRLLMSPRHMKHKFLTAKEKEDFFMGYKMRVGVIGPDLKEFNLCFSMWGGKWYVITSRWRSLVESNGLKAGDVIQVWSFRVDGALEFVVHKMESSSKSGPKTTMDVVDCDDDEDMAVISGGSGSSGDNDH